MATREKMVAGLWDTLKWLCCQRRPSSFNRGAPMRERQVTVNGVDIVYREQGEGPLALLLHGVPLPAPTYRFLMPALAEAGFRAVAPFARGFAPSSVPPADRLHLSDLVADANALHEVLGGDEHAVLIGHDFGAATAWAAAVQAPKRWSRLVACDVPPLRFFGPMAMTPEGIEQFSHFWFFQMSVADEVVGADDMAYVRFLLDKHTADGYDFSEDLGYAKEGLRNPENRTAMVGLYRSNFSADRFGTPDWAAEQSALWGELPTQPTLNLFGSEDQGMKMTDEVLATIVDALPPGSAGAIVEGSGHFCLTERPAETNAHILRFLAETA
ncbi:MAG TPA: alpha/beta hydrolase [Micromonospora sp.]